MPGAKQELMKKLWTLILVLSVLSSVASSVRSEEAQTKQSFASFLTRFRAAVAKDDKEAVAGMTKFPIDINANVTREAFLKKYHEYFTQSVRKCFAKEKPVADEQSHRASYNLFCGNDIFTFERVDGEYRLTSIGFND
jgi:hypothetical protein